MNHDTAALIVFGALEPIITQVDACIFGALSVSVTVDVCVFTRRREEYWEKLCGPTGQSTKRRKS